MKTEKEIKLLEDLLAVAFKAANLDLRLRRDDYGDEDDPVPAIEIYIPDGRIYLCVFQEDRFFSTTGEMQSLWVLEDSKVAYNYPHAPDDCEPFEVFCEGDGYRMAKRVTAYIVERAVEGALENYSENLWLYEMNKEWGR